MLSSTEKRGLFLMGAVGTTTPVASLSLWVLLAPFLDAPVLAVIAVDSANTRIVTLHMDGSNLTPLTEES